MNNLTMVAALPGSGGGATAWKPAEVWNRPSELPVNAEPEAEVAKKVAKEPAFGDSIKAEPEAKKPKSKLVQEAALACSTERQLLLEATRHVYKAHGKQAAVDVLTALGCNNLASVPDYAVPAATRAMYDRLHLWGLVWLDGDGYRLIQNMTAGRLKRIDALLTIKQADTVILNVPKIAWLKAIEAAYCAK